MVLTEDEGVVCVKTHPITFPLCATTLYSSKEYHSYCVECEWCSLECYHSRSSLYSTSPNPGSEECYPERFHETCADGQLHPLLRKQTIYTFDCHFREVGDDAKGVMMA